jgi:hypothetical protein
MVGTFSGDVNITNGNSEQCSVTIPQDAKAGQAIHLIFEVTDSGTPALTRYQWMIVTVRGK